MATVADEYLFNVLVVGSGPHCSFLSIISLFLGLLPTLGYCRFFVPASFVLPSAVMMPKTQHFRHCSKTTKSKWIQSELRCCPLTSMSRDGLFTCMQRGEGFPMCGRGSDNLSPDQPVSPSSGSCRAFYQCTLLLVKCTSPSLHFIVQISTFPSGHHIAHL